MSKTGVDHRRHQATGRRCRSYKELFDEIARLKATGRQVLLDWMLVQDAEIISAFDAVIAPARELYILLPQAD